MQYITTTQLRTKSKELVKALENGQSVDLVHRSKIVAQFVPAQKEPMIITDVNEFKKNLKSIKPKRLVPRSQRENVYRKALEEKYGKSLF